MGITYIIFFGCTILVGSATIALSGYLPKRKVD